MCRILWRSEVFFFRSSQTKTGYPWEWNEACHRGNVENAVKIWKMCFTGPIFHMMGEKVFVLLQTSHQQILHTGPLTFINLYRVMSETEQQHSFQTMLNSHTEAFSALQFSSNHFPLAVVERTAQFWLGPPSGWRVISVSQFLKRTLEPDWSTQWLSVTMSLMPSQICSSRPMLCRT